MKARPRLPVAQLTILSVCRFAEPIALTSVFPYLPEMIENFNVPKNEIAKWVGLTTAIFSLTQALTAIPWGRASDKFGRKSIILIGLINTAITFTLWGFSTSLPMAMTVRALQGATNGNIGIIRTMVAEMCPWKELQPRAFSIMPLVWNFGSIFGPSFGGLLANPYHVQPGKPHGNRLLERYPYALPNILAATLFLIGIGVGFLFLRETLETVKDNPDMGITLGKRIGGVCKTSRKSTKEEDLSSNETAPLIIHGQHGDEESTSTSTNAAPTHPAPYQSPPSLREVITFQSLLVLIAYTLLAMYDIGYGPLLATFLHYPVESDQAIQLPLLFSNGFGLDPDRIGLFFTVAGVFSMVFQYFLFPVIARRYGPLACLRVCIAFYPFVFFFTPFTALFPTDATRQIAILSCLLLKQACSVFMFPCLVILLTNSASSLRILGTLNGVATSVSALGRAAGPASAGLLFSWGYEHNFIILPFWILGLLAILSGVPAFYMVEGKGFGGDDVEQEDEGQEEDEEHLGQVHQHRGSSA